MAYAIDDLPLERFLAPAAGATAALARLDERLARSPIGEGVIARIHMQDAIASLWLDGELVHMEDLVLHDAHMDNRAPSHALTIAHSALRLRRQIAGRAPGWALGPAGLRQVLGRNFSSAPEAAAAPAEDGPDPLLADVDALLARTDALLRGAAAPERPVRDALIHDEDWDEEARLEEWRACLDAASALPPVLRAAVAHDAWFTLEVTQRSAWVGRLLAAASLRQSGLAAHHLPGLSVGLRERRPDERRSPDRIVRLKSFLAGLEAAAEAGMKEHDRLMLAREQMLRRLKGRRSSSRLPQLAEMALRSPLISGQMVEKELRVTQQGALKLIAELGLREITGRGRFRAWGLL